MMLVQPTYQQMLRPYYDTKDASVISFKKLKSKRKCYQFLECKSNFLFQTVKAIASISTPTSLGSLAA